MSDGSVESSIREDVGDDIEVHDTKDPDEIYVTNPSKMRLVLQQFEKAIRAKTNLLNPIVLGITTSSVLFVSDFNTTFGFSAEMLRTAFVIITVGCVIWLARLLYTVYIHRGKTDAEYVINELKSSK